jgi:hypothetical protein
LAWLACPTAHAVEVRLTVTDDARTPRSAGTVTSGIPLPRGAVSDVGRLSVSANGKPLAAQFLKLAPWPDGSVRWALCDTQVDLPAGGSVELLVRDDGANRAPKDPVKVTDAAETVTVSTGPLELTVDKRKPGLLGSVKVDGSPRLTAAGRGLVLYTANGKQVVAGPPESVTVEQAGPMKAIVCAKGTFPGVHDGLLGYTVRITAYAGRRFLKLHVWLRNEGAHGYAPREKPYKPQWFLFDGMAVELGLGLGGSIRAACEGVEATGALKVLQAIQPARDRTAPAYTMNDFVYTVSSGDKQLKRGLRTDGVVRLAGASGRLTAAVRHFWQQYEKAIELTGDTLRIWLWPTEGQYPRKIIGHFCPGYSRKMIGPLIHPGLYNLPGAIHKGHEMILDFSARNAAQTAAELSAPLFALASAEHYASTEAAVALIAPPQVRTDDDECNLKLDAWMRMTRSVADPKHPSSIWHARTQRKVTTRNWSMGFWHGWMDFGDLAIPGSGSVSLHYDWPWICMANAMRTGDLRFLRLATEMTRHQIDVDQQWSDREQAEYRGFQRVGYTYAHFHCGRFTRSQPNVITNWLAGVVQYYLLTGDPKTYECIQRNAAAIVPAWEQILRSRDYYVRRLRGHMQGVARTMFGFCAMHALTGERKWLDFSLKLFNECVVPKRQALGPHLHDRKQIRSQGYTRDDMRYCYSIQAFCLLHHLTGDKKLLELLKAGCDTPFPENYFDAPLFLADLNAYVAMVTGDDDYMDEAVEHWISSFPESRCPPVYLPENSQWSRRKAMFLRTGHLLQYAYWKRGAGK